MKNSVNKSQMSKYSAYLLSFCFMSLSIFAGYAQVSPACTTPSFFGWGNNGVGQLADGLAGNNTTRPTKIIGTDWKEISLGEQYTLGVKTDGSLWACGYNSQGQLGDGGNNDQRLIQIGTSNDWKTVSAGRSYSVGIKTDGSIWGWGYYNYQGQLGEFFVSGAPPVQIGTSTDWKSVSVGWDHIVALKTNGSLWAWGANGANQLGDGTTTNRQNPIQIGSGTDWKQISAGIGHTAALKNDGSLWAWGNQVSGIVSSPLQLGSAKDWQKISAGSYYSVAIKIDGSLWSWGSGQAGSGNLASTSLPVKISNSLGWTEVSAGFNFTIGVKSNGTLWAWGSNSQGVLGEGYIETVSPTQVGVDTDWFYLGQGCTRYHSIAGKCSATLEYSPTKCYKIVSKKTKKVLEVKQASQAEGAQIYQWASNNNANQLWQIVKLSDGKYNIVSRSSGKLIDIVDNSPAGYCVEGTIIQQFTADGTNSQKWRIEAQIDGSIKIYNATCNKPLRVEGGSTTDGTNVGVKNDFGTDEFKWFLEEVPCVMTFFIEPQKCYQIVNKATNKVLEVKDSLLTDGAQIYQWAATNNRKQQVWNITLLTDGKYCIKSVGTGKVMDIVDNTPAGFCTEGTIIQQFSYDGTNSQRWGIVAQADGYYKILNTTCNKYLRVESASTADGASVGIKNDFGTDAFKWFFQEANCTTGTALSTTAETFGFEAHASEGRAKLQWITNTGYKNDYFEVERLNTNGNFDILGRQNAQVGDDMKSYTFTDKDPLDGDNFYRINSISNSNTPPQYSEVKKVTFSKNDGINIFPNPADEFINVDLRKYEGKTVALSVYNSVGLLVKKQTIEKVSAAPQQIDVQGFGTGSYLLRVQSEGKREVTRLFHIAK